MVFKRLRYYTIIGILIVALVLGLAFGGSMATATDNIQPELPEQSLPTVPDDDTPDDDTEDNNDTTETMPVFKNAYKLWEYSYDIFKNGKGYYAIMSGQADATIGTQYMYSVYKRNGPVSNYSDNLEISYRKGTSSFLDSSVLITYTDKTGLSYRQSTTNYVFAESYVIDTAPTTFPYTKKFDWGERDVHDFLLNVTSKTSKLVYFDRTKDDYYEFKVTMNSDAVPSNYYNPVTSSPYVSHIPQESINISITFKISKVNGHLLSYVLDEYFEVVPAGILGVVGNQKTHNYITYTFYEMDKEQNIENPFTEFGF